MNPSAISLYLLPNFSYFNLTVVRLFPRVPIYIRKPAADAGCDVHSELPFLLRALASATWAFLFDLVAEFLQPLFTLTPEVLELLLARGEIIIDKLRLDTFPSPVMMNEILAFRCDEAFLARSVLDAQAHIARLDCTHHGAERSVAVPIVGDLAHHLPTRVVGPFVVNTPRPTGRVEAWNFPHIT